MSDRLLTVKGLKTSFFTPAGEVRAVDGVSFNLDKGKVLGIVGESGSGKSVTAYSVMRILATNGRIMEGTIVYSGSMPDKVPNDNRGILSDSEWDLAAISEANMRKIRGNKISIIFQDPMTSLNPVYTIGNQILEAILLHTGKDKVQAKARAIELLTLVGINNPERRLKQYPYEFSGGMRQRVMIAMALACEPDILIADEPTTALDVTIQAQILELLRDIQQKMGMATVLITHDLGVVASMCDEVIVMYAGKAVERGTAREIYYNPRHEYTKGLLKSIPSLSEGKRRLTPIEGSPVDLLNKPKGCAFSPRCAACMKVCLEQFPPEIFLNKEHIASCWLNVKDGFHLADNSGKEPDTSVYPSAKTNGGRA